MQTESPATSANCVMTPQSIDAYIRYEQDRGASKDSISNFKRFTNSLFEWLPEDKTISRQRLLAWRKNLKDHGYSPLTEQGYVKGVNRYLDYVGCSDIRFHSGKAKDLSGMQFGYLTAIEPTGEKREKGHIWRCVCRCGTEVECLANNLLKGNTTSCGCLRREHLKTVNKFIDGTSLRQSLEEQVYSNRSSSGYTGVTGRDGKWRAQITYKGQTYSLGSYTNLADAVKARARGKELVQMDALGLLDFYEELHKNDPALPNRAQRKTIQKTPEAEPASRSEAVAMRRDNTSGYPGVFQKLDKWAAKITYQKITYRLGSYQRIEDAIAVRKEAEQALQRDPEGFPEWVLRLRQSQKQQPSCAKQ